MWDDDELLAAVRGHPLEAAEALAAVQIGPEPVLTMDSLAAAAALLGRDAAELLVAELGRRNLSSRFGAALESRDVPLGPPERPAFVDHIDAGRFTHFSPRAHGFRCRVLVNGTVTGSGCLIGPSLVLTAWHVVAIGPPSGPQEPAPCIRVELADSTEEDAVVPPSFQSLCGDDEFTGTAPTSDDDVTGRNDVAVLSMRRPVATHLGYVGLPATPPRTVSKGALVLVHFPAGQDQGWGFGRLASIPEVTARWQHTITTLAGSSGGACFDRHLELVGLHQGKWAGQGRLVPLSRFIDDLRPLVAADLAPKALWSLDGTHTGPLVIGRETFFEAVAATGADDGRVRGLRIKRADVSGSTTGLAFSYDMLAAVLQRREANHTLVRIPIDGLVTDLVEVIHSRVAATGLPVADVQAAAGTAADQGSPERRAGERGRLLAGAMEEAAATAGRTVWLFFDTPSVTLTQSARLLFEAVVASALRQPHLRLVVAGFETVALPGQEFMAPTAAVGPGPPGLVVEFLGGFTRRQVLDFLTRACRDLARVDPNPLVIEAAADRVLARLASFNGVYKAGDLELVVAAVRDDLLAWWRQGGGIP
jgi:Trypsin-like peptidase domain